jgi:hypothetical protein
MSSKRRNDWYRKLPGVSWGDVWEWVAEVREDYGLWSHVVIHPPLPSRAKKDWGMVLVVTKRFYEGGEAEVHHLWRTLPLGGKETAEQLALSLLAQLAKQLDREVWEAERAAGEGELPF